MIRLVSFDIWRTILDLSRFYDIVSNNIALIAGREHNEVKKVIDKTYKLALIARLKGEFKRPVYDSASFFARALDIDVDTLFKAVAKSIYDERIGDLIYPDVIPTLKELKERGLKIALLGNVMFWPGMVTRAILYRNGILKYIDVTLFGDEIGVQKPDKQVFHMLSSIVHCNLDEIVHVGDSLVNDFAGALLAGVKAVLIKRDLDVNIIKLSDNAYIINRLEELLKILGSF